MMTMMNDSTYSEGTESKRSRSILVKLQYLILHDENSLFCVDWLRNRIPALLFKKRGPPLDVRKKHNASIPITVCWYQQRSYCLKTSIPVLSAQNRVLPPLSRLSESSFLEEAKQPPQHISFDLH
jgi:hypothetical protein